MNDTTNIQVLYFESTGEAYDETQCNEDIKDGAVLVIREERVVGFLMKAWPVAVTKEYGNLHRTSEGHSPNELENGNYINSVTKACELARKYGFELQKELVS